MLTCGVAGLRKLASKQLLQLQSERALDVRIHTNAPLTGEL